MYLVLSNEILYEEFLVGNDESHTNHDSVLGCVPVGTYQTSQEQWFVIIYVKHLNLKYSACLLWRVAMVLNNNDQSIILLLFPIKQQPCADEASVAI
jgi:hypothetical protein